jgi:hypothetical protein
MFETPSTVRTNDQAGADYSPQVGWWKLALLHSRKWDAGQCSQGDGLSPRRFTSGSATWVVRAFLVKLTRSGVHCTEPAKTSLNAVWASAG